MISISCLLRSMVTLLPLKVQFLKKIQHTERNISFKRKFLLANGDVINAMKLFADIQTVLCNKHNKLLHKTVIYRSHIIVETRAWPTCLPLPTPAPSPIKNPALSPFPNIA